MPHPPHSEPESWVTLARLLRPQGRKGEILADLLTDFPERFADRGSLFLRAPNAPPVPTEVHAHWLPLGKNAGRVVLKLSGIDSITAAEALAGCELLTPAQERLPLPTDDAYVTDLIGCTLLVEGHPIGTIEDVQFATTPDGAARLPEASDLLVVHDPAGREILIPFVKAWILSTDLPARRLEMNLPDGLLDLNL